VAVAGPLIGRLGVGSRSGLIGYLTRGIGGAGCARPVDATTGDEGIMPCRGRFRQPARSSGLHWRSSSARGAPPTADPEPHGPSICRAAEMWCGGG
jgi:hypothetical protein